jgi:hypothetical protein
MLHTFAWKNIGHRSDQSQREVVVCISPDLRVDFFFPPELETDERKIQERNPVRKKGQGSGSTHPISTSNRSMDDLS